MPNHFQANGLPNNRRALSNPALGIPANAVNCMLSLEDARKRAWAAFFAEVDVNVNNWRQNGVRREVLTNTHRQVQSTTAGTHSAPVHFLKAILRGFEAMIAKWGPPTPELKAQIDDEYRTLSGPRTTGVMGSSLGGVVSFYLAWQYPQVFGNVACLSSTFSWRDDLIERVRREPSEPRSDLRIYLDSGWPNDNYEVTLSLANALVERGFMVGRDLIHFAFPHHRHTEGAWASRVPAGDPSLQA